MQHSSSFKSLSKLYNKWVVFIIQTEQCSMLTEENSLLMSKQNLESLSEYTEFIFLFKLKTIKTWHASFLKRSTSEGTLKITYMKLYNVYVRIKYLNYIPHLICMHQHLHEKVCYYKWSPS
jgi:hypothetical protein